MKVEVNRAGELTLVAETQEEDYLLSQWWKGLAIGESTFGVAFTDETTLSSGTRGVTEVIDYERSE